MGTKLNFFVFSFCCLFLHSAFYNTCMQRSISTSVYLIYIQFPQMTIKQMVWILTSSYKYQASPWKKDMYCWVKVCRKQTRVVMGDLNYPDINWKKNSASNERSNRFLMCLNDNFYHPKVEEGIWESATLDLILTSREEMVEGVEVIGSGTYRNFVRESN